MQCGAWGTLKCLGRRKKNGKRSGFLVVPLFFCILVFGLVQYTFSNDTPTNDDDVTRERCFFFLTTSSVQKIKTYFPLFTQLAFFF